MAQSCPYVASPRYSDEDRPSRISRQLLKTSIKTLTSPNQCLLSYPYKSHNQMDALSGVNAFSSFLGETQLIFMHSILSLIIHILSSASCMKRIRHHSITQRASKTFLPRSPFSPALRIFRDSSPWLEWHICENLEMKKSYCR